MDVVVARPLITYDGGFFYPLDNRHFTVDPIDPTRLHPQPPPRIVKPEAPPQPPQKMRSLNRHTANVSHTSGQDFMDDQDALEALEQQNTTVGPSHSMRATLNRRLHEQAVKQGRSLSFVYNGGSASGMRRTVRPIANGSGTEKFKAYDATESLKVYHYAKIEDMQLA